MMHQKTEHDSKSSMSDNMLLGITAIFSIILIVFIVYVSANPARDTSDNIGQASGVLLNDANSDACKIIVGQTSEYDYNNMAISLASNDYTYYKGYTVSAGDINDNGCIISVNGNGAYLAKGQVQKIGPLYVTVTDILN